MNNQNRQFDFLDLLNILSFMIGLENLYENRSQSAQNDVNAANDREAHYILDAIGKRLDAQDAMLNEILERLDKLS